jgi:hypothetical protein
MAGREDFLRVRKTGVSLPEAGRTPGVRHRTAQEWDCGMRKSNGRRIYPDGGLSITNVL